MSAIYDKKDDVIHVEDDKHIDSTSASEIELGDVDTKRLIRKM